MLESIRSLDYYILGLFHSLALSHGNIFNPIAKFFHYIGSPLTCAPAIICLILFVVSRKKRWLIIFVAMCCSSVISQLLIKRLVGRIRPFNSEVITDFKDWWIAAGSINETGNSFPSGHSASSMGFAVSTFITSKKRKISWLGFVYAFIMACSRCYAIVHYPSDVIVGLTVGAIVGYMIVVLFKRYDKATE